jgi:pyruvate kinase
MIHKKTKIICTLGPATDNIAVLRQMIKAGMNVARINMSHGIYEEHAKRINLVKTIREEFGIPIAVMLDTKGPEVRIKTFKQGKVELKKGDLFTLTPKDIEGDKSHVSITFPDLYKYLKKNDTILSDEGNIELNVEKINNQEIITKVVSGGFLSNRKSLNFPDVEIEMEYLSEIDKKDISFGVEQGVDFIALSFVRSDDDVRTIRNFMKTIDGTDVALISKIENRQGVNNMDTIINASEGIMVARGDMGVEIPFEELPGIQKKLIKKCNKAGKIVITATQMLESMITNPRPTRAEISDVANAVHDGTSATMLSGETAMGKYPLETVKTMAKIIKHAEKSIDYKKTFNEHNIAVHTIRDAIAHSATNAAHVLNAKAIVIMTFSGESARRLSCYRPQAPIIVATPSQKTFYKLSLSWGVTPVNTTKINDFESLIFHATDCALKTEIVKENDLIVIAAAVPVGTSENINMIKILRVET